MVSGSDVEISFTGEEFLGPIREGLALLKRQKVIPRIFKKDWTVWKEDPTEIRNKLGWLDSPRRMEKDLASIQDFARSARDLGYTQALLLGMGGSSLAPHVLADVIAARGYLDLDILDSTDPQAVLRRQRRLHPAKTLFIVSSKSGTTVETDSLFKFFWNWAEDRLGRKETGKHFAAITDPGTPLESEAQRLRFSAVFRGDPEIGGRFSALSAFGLMPAALTGTRVRSLLRRAAETAGRCRRYSDIGSNPGAYLGAALGTLARKGRDKMTLVLSPRLRSFGLWLEQLIAESTGKDGRGILPIDGEAIGGPEVYGDDRFFILIQEKGSRVPQAAIGRLEKAGFPVLVASFPGAHSLGGQFFLWEFATAVAGFLLGVNPFDQPDVDAAKRRTQEFLEFFLKRGALPDEKPRFVNPDFALYTDIEAPAPAASFKSFLSKARAGDYLAIQAFLDDNRETGAALQKLRHSLRARTRLATTVGFGPRFLHSTGQLQKGDRGNGLFIQITAADPEDAPIPETAGSSGSSSGLTFGILKAAQARGDFAALKAAGRRIIRIHLRAGTAAGLRRIAALLD